MAINEELKIMIRSIFDSKGIKKAKNSLKSLTGLAKKPLIGKAARTSLDDMLVLDKRKMGKKVKDITAGLNTMTGKYSDMGKKVKKPLEQTTSSFKDFGKESTIAFEAKKYQTFLDQNKRLKQFGFQVGEGGKVLNKFGKGMSDVERKALISPKTGADFETFNKQLYASPKMLRKTGLGMKNFRQQFQMHLLSVMFFGMQMQRVFMQMGRRTLESFLKITEGTTAAGQGINMLQGAFATLKFAVGEALAEALLPFIPTILDIIMRIVDFIETHKKLVAMIVVGGAAFGTMLFMVGQVGLGIQGVSTLFIKMGAAIGLSTGPLLIFFALGIALVAVFIKAWKEFPEVVTPLVKGALAEIRDGLKNVWESLKVVANEITGGEEGWISMASIAIWSIALIADALDSLIDLVNTLIRSYMVLVDVMAMQRKVMLKGALYVFSKEYKSDLANVKKDWEGLKTAGKELFKPTKMTEYTKMGPKGIYKLLMAGKEEIKQVGTVLGQSTASGIEQGFSTGYEQVMTPYGMITTDKFKGVIEKVSTDTSQQWFDYGTQIGTSVTEGLKTSNIIEDIQSIFTDVLSFGKGVTGEIGAPKMEFDVIPKVDEEASARAIGALEGLQTVTGPLGVDFETIKNVLGTKGGKEGTIPSIGFLADTTNTAKEKVSSLKGNLSTLKEKMGTVGTFITDTFNNQINSSVQALLWDSRAAMSAAFAQERYNRAKQGATGA